MMRKPYYKHKKKRNKDGTPFNRHQSAAYERERKRREGYVGHTYNKDLVEEVKKEKQEKAAKLKALNERDRQRGKPAPKPRPTRASI